KAFILAKYVIQSQRGEPPQGAYSQGWRAGDFRWSLHQSSWIQQWRYIPRLIWASAPRFAATAANLSPLAVLARGLALRDQVRRLPRPCLSGPGRRPLDFQE